MSVPLFPSGPTYDPPYDSPIEDILAYSLTKYLSPLVSLDKQVEIETACGRFRPDFIVRGRSKVLAFECDGEKYHSIGLKGRARSRDQWRDAMLLNSHPLDAIYRFRGKDIFHHIEDCLYVVSRWDPEIFSERGLVNLEALASAEARRENYASDLELGLIGFEYPTHGGLLVFRRSIQFDVGERYLCKEIFDFVMARGGGNLDSLMEQYYKLGSIDDTPDY